MTSTRIRDRIEDGFPLVVLNQAGTIGHFLMGVSGRSLECGRLSPGEGPAYEELPDGARMCRTCVRVHNKAHADRLRQAKQDAGYALTLHTAKLEKCRPCRLAKPHRECPNEPLNERMRTEIRSWSDLTSPRLVWERVRLYEANTWRFTAEDRGVYLDGNQGWHNNHRVVDMATGFGMVLDDQDREDLAAYKGEETSHEAAGAVIDQGGLVDRATEFLDSITEPGSAWEWDMGELSLREDVDEDA